MASKRACPVKHLSDLPATALALVCSNLGKDDKKNLALTCTALSTVILSLWTAILVDLSSEDPPPRRLSTFSAVYTIVVADLPQRPLSAISLSTEPAFSKEVDEQQNRMPFYGAKPLQRLQSVVATFQAAPTAAQNIKSPCRHRNGVQPPKLSLQIALPGYKTGDHLEFIVHSMSLPRRGRTLRDLALKYLGSNSIFMRALVALGAVDTSEDDLNTSPNYPFDRIDAGWIIPDGRLTDLICKGSVAWWPDMPGPFQLELYTRLHTLRLELCVAGFDVQEFYTAFNSIIYPKVNALQGLKELHIGYFEYSNGTIYLKVDDLNLPSLTRLVLGDGFGFDSFSSFTHLQQLRELSVNLGHISQAEEHPQDLASLSSLSNLSDLHVHQLCVEVPQNIHLLQQLTSLCLHGLHGSVALIQPTAPMPKLRKLSLPFFFFVMSGDEDHRTIIKQRMQDVDVVINWFMDNAATTFPNIQVLTLGVESIKVPLKTNSDVNQAISKMDLRVNKLFVDATHMKHFKMFQGGSQSASLLEKFPNGAIGPTLSSELDVNYRLSQSSKWQRNVKLVLYPVAGTTLMQQVSYEYTRKE